MAKSTNPFSDLPEPKTTDRIEFPENDPTADIPLLPLPGFDGFDPNQLFRIRQQQKQAELAEQQESTLKSGRKAAQAQEEFFEDAKDAPQQPSIGQLFEAFGRILDQRLAGMQRPSESLPDRSDAQAGAASERQAVAPQAEVHSPQTRDPGAATPDAPQPEAPPPQVPQTTQPDAPRDLPLIAEPVRPIETDPAPEQDRSEPVQTQVDDQPRREPDSGVDFRPESSQTPVSGVSADSTPQPTLYTPETQTPQTASTGLSGQAPDIRPSEGVSLGVDTREQFRDLERGLSEQTLPQFRAVEQVARQIEAEADKLARPETDVRPGQTAETPSAALPEQAQPESPAGSAEPQTIPDAPSADLPDDKPRPVEAQPVEQPQPDAPQRELPEQQTRQVDAATPDQAQPDVPSRELPQQQARPVEAQQPDQAQPDAPRQRIPDGEQPQAPQPTQVEPQSQTPITDEVLSALPREPEERQPPPAEQRTDAPAAVRQDLTDAEASKLIERMELGLDPSKLGGDIGDAIKKTDDGFEFSPERLMEMIEANAADLRQGEPQTTQLQEPREQPDQPEFRESELAEPREQQPQPQGNDQAMRDVLELLTRIDEKLGELPGALDDVLRLN